ncbi:MAG: BrnA antitoxin family protein [Treponema sp.]|jgi:uncharacterized protein (DUF4415 family)|nr:BrnA antitoxin family protein [Treponema sp.]
MEKIIRKNSKKIRKEWTPEKLVDLAKKEIPSFPTGILDEDMATGRVKHLGRGFATFKENINRNGRPSVAEKKVVVSIRLPGPDAEKLRAMGKGWQTKVGNYLIQGIRHGKIANITQ